MGATIRRLVKTVAVESGSVYVVPLGGSPYLPTGGSSALGSTARVFAESLFGIIYFADGLNYKKYDANADEVQSWTASAGSLPASGSDKARLIESYAGRIILSGVIGDEHNWFMSAVGDPTDWDYAPSPATETQAVAGNNSEAGKLGDVINGMAPISDDLLLFGGDHTLWRMSGDPASGGRLDLLSDQTGMAYGRAWCKDPNGAVYFFGSRGGVYRTSGGAPEKITRGAIDERLAEIDLEDNLVRMAWSDRELGLYVVISPLTAGSTTHYFYDARLEAWWPVQFADNNHNAESVDTFDADDPNDRALVLGGLDGYLRKIDVDADDDDGSAISSRVLIGPVDAEGLPFILSEVQATLSGGSDNLTVDILAGDNAEDASAAASAYNATFSAGRNRVIHPRSRGYAAYVKLSNATLDQRWSLERLAVKLSVLDRSQRRQF